MTRNDKRLAAMIVLAVSMTLLFTLSLGARGDELTHELDAARIAPAAGVGRDDPITIPEKTTTQEPEQPQEPEQDEENLQSLGTFKLTAYCACAKCCGKWANGITFTGTEATPGRTIAVDPSIIPLGSTIYINGQPYIAEDVGGAIKGNRIDIFYPTHNEALRFGVQYAEVIIHQHLGGNI